MKTIYLDHAAATPLRKEVLDAMLPYLRESYGNPSSIHHKGREANDALSRARNTVATVLDVHAHEIIFTSGGTEANNLALLGSLPTQSRGREHVLISSVEHPSILAVGEYLSQEGCDVEYIPVDMFGRVSVHDILERIRPETALISLMYANNEIGTVEPIQELAMCLRRRFGNETRPLLHTDACQAAGQLPIAPRDLGVDLMTLNSGKIYGPKGTGMLYVADSVSLTPHVLGGEQESGRRAGTEHVAGIVGFARALELAVTEQAETQRTLTGLRKHYIRKLYERIPGVRLNGHADERLPNNIHISLPYIEGESLVLMLDEYGICASTGSACTAHNLLPSHVLRAIGQSPDVIHGSLRLTLGRDTTAADLDTTVEALVACTRRLQTLSPLPLSL